MKSVPKQKEKGFTLVEVIVAVAILGVAMAPALILASSALNVAARTKNNLIAANLAQEGVEAVRAMRDDAWFAGSSLIQSPPADGVYEVEWNSTALLPNQDRFLKIAANGLYNYSAGTDSIFKRAIDIQLVTQAGINELKVISKVSWQERGTPKTVEVESHFFDWK